MPEEPGDNRGQARQSFLEKQQLIETSRTAFQLMSAVLRNVSLYPESHPIMLTGAEKLRSKINELLVNRIELTFYVVSGELFVDKTSIPVDQNLSLFIEHFAARDVGAIVFKHGITTEDLIRFAVIMQKEPGFLAGKEDATNILIREGVGHTELHRVQVVGKEAAEAIKTGKQASNIFKETIESVKEMVSGIQIDKAANVRKMNAVVQTLVDNIMENRDTFLGLTNLKMYDEYTFAHSVNVSILSVSLGAFLSFTKPQIAALGLAGLMHDIGKLNVPHEVINKAGKLTDAEWELIKLHPVEGALLLAGTPGISRLAMIAAFEHHQQGGERGYPRPNGHLSQHPFSQIISITDAYEAITAARVYYSSQTSPDEAVRILLQKRGKPFNPVLVNAFVRMIGIFPVGTLLKLTTGETALVMSQTADLLRPRVLVLTKFDGSERGTPTISLLETSGGRYKRSIAGTINPWAAKLDVKKYLE